METEARAAARRANREGGGEISEWRQWGWFHSMAAARDAVARLQPGSVRYERRGAGQVEVLVKIDYGTREATA